MVIQSIQIDTIELINCNFSSIYLNNSGGNIYIYNEIDILLLNNNFSNSGDGIYKWKLFKYW